MLHLLTIVDASLGMSSTDSTRIELYEEILGNKQLKFQGGLLVFMINANDSGGGEIRNLRQAE